MYGFYFIAAGARKILSNLVLLLASNIPLFIQYQILWLHEYCRDFHSNSNLNFVLCNPFSKENKIEIVEFDFLTMENFELLIS